jgi:short-subunit dehydrogenase
MRSLEGQRVLITGAGRGLGRELAIEFAAAGCHVVVADLDGCRARETADAIVSNGGDAVAYPMNVCDPDSVLSVRESVHSRHGLVDALVNNAGVVHGGAFLSVPVDRHRTTFDVNVLGLVATTHAFLPDLITQPAGHLVNIASASAFIALPFGATYASSKWAVLGFSESIREELRTLGHGHVRVTAVCPEYITTGMFAGATSPRLTRPLSPSQVARMVVRGVRRDRELVLAGRMVRLTPLVQRVLPRAWFRWFCRQLGVSTSMSAWRGHQS